MSLKKRIFLCAVCCALLLIPAGGLWWLDASGKAAVAAAKERIRAAGLPLTIDEIRPPRVPDADNAALVLAPLNSLFDEARVARSYYVLTPLRDFKKSHSLLRLDAAGAKELAVLLETQHMRDALALIKQAVTKKGYDAKQENGQLFTGVLETWSVVGMAELLGWHAGQAANQGYADEAYADVLAMMALADFLAGQPSIGAQRDSWSIWKMALDQLEQLAAIESLPVAWNQKVADRLSGLNLSNGFARALDLERISGSEGLPYGSIGLSALWNQPNPRIDRFKTLRYNLPGVLRLEYADYLDRMREARGIVAQPSLGYQMMAQKLDAVLQGISDDKLILQRLNQLKLHADFLWHIRAKIGSTEAGLALERYRTAKGGYPATMAELVPAFLREVPVDIFTGKPLIYRAEPGGAVIYNVGRNLKDDGGIEDFKIGKDDQGWAAGAAALWKFAPPPPAPPEPPDGP